MEKINKPNVRRPLSYYINYRNALMAMSVLFLLIGVLFYVSWSILYGTWSDPGLYSFCLPMAIFGFLGVAFVKSGAFN
jgi:multidrug efflux pump subunit AcrB